MGVRNHQYIIITELEFDGVELEVPCSAYKLLEVRNGIGELIEEKDLSLSRRGKVTQGRSASK